MAANLPLQMVRWANTIFCDDIRQEVSGKMLVVGMYGESLVVPAFPVTLPTLCAVITIATPVKQPFKQLAVRLHLDDGLIAEMIVQGGDLGQVAELSPLDQQAEPVDTEDAARVWKSRMVVNLSPFMIEKPGLLRVRIESESEIIPGGALRIEAIKPEEAAPAGVQ